MKKLTKRNKGGMIHIQTDKERKRGKEVMKRQKEK
jgi:hypothetical protein